MHFARSFFASLSNAWRSLKRRPAYFAIAVSSLAIALGLATTVIAHLDSLVHPDLGTPFADRLFLAHVEGNGVVPPADSELVRLFTGIREVERAAVVRMERSSPFVSTGQRSGRGLVWRASRDAFEVIGGKPLRGRWFLPGEREGAPVALISEDTWRREFSATDELENARLIVDGLKYRIVGVIPRELPAFQTGVRANDDDEEHGLEMRGYIVLPGTGTDTSRGHFSDRVLVRAKRGTSDANFKAPVARLAAELQARRGVGPPGRGDGRPQRGISASMYPLGAYTMFRVDGYEKAMLLAAAIIVVIACANISALMLARAVTNRRDQALRLALGAGRRHIIQGVAAEVFLIATAGAAAAIVIGDWSMRILAALTPPDLPWLGFREPHWSPWVFAGLFGVVIVAVVIASVVPAIFVSGIAPVEQLKDNSGTTTGRPRRAFQALVVGELALSLILLFGAALVAKSVDEVAAFDFGYEPRGLTAVWTSLLLKANPQPCTAERQKKRECWPGWSEVALTTPGDIVARLRREPGVRDAAWVMGGGGRNVFVSDESQAIDRQLLNPVEFYAGPGYFRTLGVPLIEGRDFVEGDQEGLGAAILDELSVRVLFPEGKAVGKMVKVGTAKTRAKWIPVVGVVRSVMHELPADPAVEIKPVAYLATMGRGSPGFIVRAERGETDITPRVATIVSDLIPPGTTMGSGPWLRRYDQMLKTRGFIAGMFLTMSLASLALAAAGLFGVLSYSVNQRMREFAVRVALGAQRGHVVKLVLVDGFVMALAGTAIGGAVAMYAAFVLWEWLWGVYPVDAQALIISEGILLAVTALGALLPALRATRANPVDVMRAT